MGGGDGDTGPTTEGFGIVPAICLAPVGLALLPADRKLVRGACKQRQSSQQPVPKGTVFVLKKRGEQIQGTVVEKKEERETKGIREAKNARL